MFQRSVAGDFPGLAYEIIVKRSTVTNGSLHIDQLNDLLDELSRRGGKL
jgi:DNA ligase 4